MFADALAALRARRGSAAACGLAAALAVGVFIAAGVLAKSDQLAVDRSFLRLDRPVITLRGSTATQDARGVIRLSDADISRISNTAGVVAAGRMADLGTARIALGDRQRDAQVVAADPGAIRASDSPLLEGRPGHTARGGQVVPDIVLGVALARELRIPSLALGPVVRLYSRSWNVVGVISSGDARPDAAQIAVVPWAFARRASRERTVALTRTIAGYQHEIAPHLAKIALPTAPSELVSELPAAPRGLHRSVTDALAQAATALAFVTLAGGLLALFQTTSASVLRRTREIGLRRALGASREVIALQIELEVLAVGAVGAVIGAAIGATAGALAAHLNGWPLVVPQDHVVIGMLAGVAASAIAGLVPAWRASVIDPSAALRTD